MCLCFGFQCFHWSIFSQHYLVITHGACTCKHHGLPETLSKAHSAVYSPRLSPATASTGMTSHRHEFVQRLGELVGSTCEKRTIRNFETRRLLNMRRLPISCQVSKFKVENRVPIYCFAMLGRSKKASPQ